MSGQTPLWRMLGWEYDGRVVVLPGGSRMYPHGAERHVTETHLLDWLAERCDYLELLASNGQWSACCGWYGGGGHESPTMNPDRRTAIESVVRQVHAWLTQEDGAA